MFANFLSKVPRFLLLGLIVFLIALQTREEKPSVESATSKQKLEIATVELADALVFFEQAEKVEVLDTVVSQVLDVKGEVLGVVLNSTSLGSGISGFGGPTPLLVFVDSSHKILGVKLLDNAETPSYLNRVVSKKFINSWDGSTVQEALDIKVEAVSGATFSSGAIAENMEVVLAAYGAVKGEKAISWLWWVKNGFAIFVVLFGLFCYFSPRKYSKYRWLLLGSSVLILGFWQGKTFSLSLFYLWISNGIPLSMWFLFGLFVLNILLAIFQNKSYYCTYVCPYGAAQELMGKVTKKKVKLPRIINVYIGNIREQIVLICMFLLIIREVNDLSQVEVFSGFGISTASHFVFGLFVLFLILSIFFKKPWCTSFCPTGYLLELFKNKGRLKK